MKPTIQPSMAYSEMTQRHYFVSKWKAPNVASTKHDVTDQVNAIIKMAADEARIERDEARAALAELVRLKDLSDDIEKREQGGELVRTTTPEKIDYVTNKPKAWAEARRILTPATPPLPAELDNKAGAAGEEES